MSDSQVFNDFDESERILRGMFKNHSDPVAYAKQLAKDILTKSEISVSGHTVQAVQALQHADPRFDSRTATYLVRKLID